MQPVYERIVEMNKEEVAKRIESEKNAISLDIKLVDVLFDKLLNNLEKGSLGYIAVANAKWHYDMNRHVSLSEHIIGELPEFLRKDYEVMCEIFAKVPFNCGLKTMPCYADSLLDSPKKHIKGTLLITDPCYIISSIPKFAKKPVESDYVDDIDNYDDIVITETADLLEHLPNASHELIDDKTCKYSYKRDFAMAQYRIAAHQYEKCSDDPIKTDDWEISDCGRNMSKLGIINYISRDTIIGDWDCVVTDSNDTVLGEFCADAGMVCVVELSEFKNYKPDIEEWVSSHPHCVTVIEDFDGDVRFEVEDTSFDYEQEDGSVSYVEDYTVHVKGEGTKEGKPFSFTSVLGCIEADGE